MLEKDEKINPNEKAILITIVACLILAVILIVKYADVIDGDEVLDLIKKEERKGKDIC